MWLRMPVGIERISVERQNFAVEATDGEGFNYTRVPNHFVPQLLSIGFRAAEPPEGAPDDLPLADPLRDSAIAKLTEANEVLRTDTGNLRTDMGTLRAELTAKTNECIDLQRQLKEAKEKIEKLESGEGE